MTPSELRLVAHAIRHLRGEHVAFQVAIAAGEPWKAAAIAREADAFWATLPSDLRRRVNLPRRVGRPVQRMLERDGILTHAERIRHGR